MKACKETKPLSLCLLFIVLAVPSAQAQWIASVERTGNSTYLPAPAIAPAPLVEGSVCYNDRLHIYASVPTEILGAQYVQVSQRDKATTDYTLTVTMSADATLYLFLDNRLGNTGGGQGIDPILPSQMSWVTTDLGFTDTGFDIGVDEGPDGFINNYYSVFSKQVNGDDVIALGVQNDGGTRLMYAVAAKDPYPKASSPVPTNGAPDVPTNVVLSWTPGIGAISHHIYFGANQADVATGTPSTDMGTQPGTSYDPGALAYGTTYYWRVDEWDGATTYLGNIWSFTTEGQGEGSILFEYFWGTDGNGTLASLLNLPTFPDSPDQSELRTSFEGRINWRETYGTHVRGYLYPPQTGDYTFWIASDDQSQLWLSTDENPDNAVQIASVAGWTYPRDFDNTGGGVGGPEQKSSEITLEAGRRYYIEALHCEGWAGDNLAVAWQGPSITVRSVISGTFLSPWIRDIDLKAANPSPPDGATLVATDVTLTWEPGMDAIFHDIYFGTSQTDVHDGTGGTDMGTQTETSYTPGALAYGTTYYWRIDERNPAEPDSPWTGDVWSFMTESVGCPISPSHILVTASSCMSGLWPHNTVDGSGLNANDQHGTTDTTMWLSSDTAQPPTWIQYGFDRVYELCDMWVWNYNSTGPLAGLGVKDATIEYSSNGMVWTPLGDFQFAQAPYIEGYAHNTEVHFNGALAKYVKITCNSNWGSSSQCGLSEVRFYRMCASASTPNPSDGATDVPRDAVLSWTPGSGAISHAIYFGTNPTPGPAEYRGTVTETSYTPPETLAYGTTYYWRVDEYDGATTYVGDIWTFTTQGQGEGHILFEYFWGTDWLLETLLNLPTFPDSPDQSEWRTSFEGPINWRDTYGTHVRGYLYPPETGNYTFWIASDDQSQLWLSTDENPDNAVQIASVSGWTPPRDFDKTGEQTSTAIALEAGRKYYIEALHAEGWGGDNLAVAWQGPSIPTRAVISGTFLSPWIIDTATDPSPANRAADVPTDVALSWAPGIGAISHHIYFGTNQADVATGTGDTDKGAQTETAYTPGTLADGTTYYWRVDEYDGATTHTGNVWSFTTTFPPSPPALVGWWKLDETSGPIAADSSGNGLDGTLINGPVWITGQINGALQLDGVDDYVDLPIGSIMPSLSSCTVATWVNFSNAGGRWQRIWDFGSDETYNMFLTPRIDMDGNLRFAITILGSSKESRLNAPSTLPTGWHHVAVAINGATRGMEMYLDGVVVAAGTTQVLPRDLGNTTQNWLGRSQYPADAYFNGSLDDLRIYNWALTASEVTDIVNKGSNTDSDGVTNGVEDGAPNGGDGNNDGTPDSQQDNVTSLPNAVDEGYVTIVSPVGTALEGVSAIDNPSPGDTPAGVEFPVGLFEFTVSGIAPGGSSTVTLLLPAGVTVGTYYEYGLTPDDPTNHWYEFLYDGTTGAEILADRVILHFVDGLRGDGDLTVNGQIVDPGAPAVIQVVGIDIKPGSYPNSFNNDDHGVIPVAILGSESFDVSQVDVSTLRLEGLALRMKGKGDYQFSIKDVSGKFSNTMNGEPDGYPDLVCQFVDEDGVWNQGESIATVRGKLSTGAPFMGTDSVKITQ